MRGMTWFEAQAKFASCRSPRDGKPLQNNTRLYQRGSDYAVRLHSTDVVTIHSDGTFSIRTGGWHTQTTSQRIRAYSPAQVGCHKGEYYLYVPPLMVPSDDPSDYGSKVAREGYRVPFEEGIRIDCYGVPVDGRDFQVALIVKTKGA